MGFKFSKSFGWSLARDSNPGGGVVKALSVLRDSRIMRDNLRMADNG